MGRRRSISTALLRSFDEAEAPIYVVDSGRVVVYANPACCAWLGVEVDDLVGQECRYHSQPDPTPAAAAANALSPRPEVFFAQRLRGEIAFASEQSPLRCRGVEFFPLSSDPIEGVSVLAVVDLADRDAGDAGPTAARQLHLRLQELRSQIASQYRLDGLVGESPAMRRVRQQVSLAVGAGAAVLVVGPPSAGSERVAKTIHYGKQPAGAGPLAPLDCGLMDAELLQATVLAFARRCEEQSSGGSLLLLHADRLNDAAQVELAGLMQLPMTLPRVLATSETPLLQLAAAGEYRASLAHLLSGLVVDLAPLDARKSDIPLLAQQHVERLNAQGEKQLSGCDDEALEMLLAARWPGDVEAFQSVIEKAFAAADGPRIGVANLPREVQWSIDAARFPPAEDEPIELDAFLATAEAEAIRRALLRAEGNKSKAARLLGISRPRLLRRIEQLGVKTKP